MTFQDELDTLNQRIAKAERARDAWRAAGSQEQYLEACSTVSALTMQMEMLCRERAATGKRLPSPGTDG